MDVNQLLYLNETDEGAADLGAAPDPLAEGAGAGAADVAPPEPPAGPTLDPLEVEAELEHLRAQNAQWEQLFGGIQQSGYQQPDEPGFDPAAIDLFSDDAGQQIAQLIAHGNQQVLNEVRQMVGQIAAPLAARQEQETIQEGESRLQDILADDVARNGEFAADPKADQQARQLVRTLADQQFPEIAARYGHTPRAAEIAMARAADQVRTLLSTTRQQGQAEQANRLATLAGVRAEPGPAGGAVQTMSVSPASGRELARKYGSRASSLGNAA